MSIATTFKYPRLAVHRSMGFKRCSCVLLWLSLLGKPIDYEKLVKGEFEGLRRVRSPVLIITVPSFGSVGRDRCVLTLQYERNADGDPSVSGWPYSLHACFRRWRPIALAASLIICRLCFRRVAALQLLRCGKGVELAFDTLGPCHVVISLWRFDVFFSLSRLQTGGGQTALTRALTS